MGKKYRPKFDKNDLKFRDYHKTLNRCPYKNIEIIKVLNFSSIEDRLHYPRPKSCITLTLR